MKGTIITMIILIVVIALVGGFKPAVEAVKIAGTAFLSMFTAILPFLEIEQEILTKVVAIAIIQILCGLGFYVGHKSKKRIFKGVSVMADIISTILLIVG